jgi:hypothetical protein
MTTVDTRKFPAIISLRLPADKAAELRRRAEADDRPPGWLARRLILRGLEQTAESGSPAAAEVR